MAQHKDIPAFGMLQGLRVVFSASSVAGPFFGSMMADHGADVIWLENQKAPGMERNNPEEFQLAQDRRNMRNLALNVPTDQGREIFLQLMKQTDIFLESSKSRQWEKWGLDDEVLWAVNPKLVIVHLTGFGMTGVEDYVNRTSFDPIGQAFGGMLYSNYIPGQAPRPSYPTVTDYYAAYMGLFAALAAYIAAQRTGKGESIDLAQYESVIRCNPLTSMFDFNLPEGHPRRFQPGNINASSAGYNSYQCKDGEYVYMLIISSGVMERALPLFGLEYGSKEFPRRAVYRVFEPEGPKLEQAIKDYCAQRTAEEVEQELSAVGAPVMRMLKFDQMLTHPHYVARETLTTSRNSRNQEVICCNIMPKLKNNPGQIWRRAPKWGEDNADILSELGYTPEQTQEFYAADILAASTED